MAEMKGESDLPDEGLLDMSCSSELSDSLDEGLLDSTCSSDTPFNNSDAGTVIEVKSKSRKRTHFCEVCSSTIGRHFRFHVVRHHLPPAYFITTYCPSCQEQTGILSMKRKFHSNCPLPTTSVIREWVALTVAVRKFFLRKFGKESVADLPASSRTDLVLSLEERAYILLSQHALYNSYIMDLDWQGSGQLLFHWRYLYQLLTLLSPQDRLEFKTLVPSPVDVPAEIPLLVFDTHLHLDILTNTLKYSGASLATLQASSNSRFTLIGAIANFVFREHWGEIFQIMAREPLIHYSIGIHPLRVATVNPPFPPPLPIAESCVGIGEVGLDFTTKCSCVGACLDSKMCHQPKLIAQIQFLQDIVLPLVAVNQSKTLIVYCRDDGTGNAAREMLKMLEVRDLLNMRIHIHCFSGSASDVLLWATKCPRVFFGISPSILYNPTLRESVKAIPLNQLLIESNAPFQPAKYSTPWEAISLVVPCLTGALKLPEAVIVHQCMVNARRCYEI